MVPSNTEVFLPRIGLETISFRALAQIVLSFLDLVKNQISETRIKRTLDFSGNQEGINHTRGELLWPLLLAAVSAQIH